MKAFSIVLIKGAFWTVGAFGVSQLLRIASSVVLARLLAPQLFGIMLIVYSMRTAIELFSDVGIGQNIVYSNNSEHPEFYNTAWTIQLFRGILLWLVCFIAALPLAHFYAAPILIFVMPVAGFASVLAGVTSISPFVLRKRMEISKLNAFEMITGSIGTVLQIAFAYISPTIWALVLGSLAVNAVTTVGSYFLLSELKLRLFVSRKYLREILTFGKWIFLGSIVYFLSMNFDRLYLAKIVPLELLGVYGIARNISDLLYVLINRLGNLLVFPFIASHSHMPRAELRQQLMSIRLKFCLIAALGFSISAATADFMIRILYDQRYHAAGWMLPPLIIGLWFSTISSLNESALVGFGKPAYSAVANALKFTWLLIGLPLAFTKFGFLGAIVVIAASDLCRYLALLVGQWREKFSFGIQDLAISLFTLSLIGLFEWLRWYLGLGTSFHDLPLGHAH
jgi:O-antigen/teichoic acid export membrane protein